MYVGSLQWLAKSSRPSHVGPPGANAALPTPVGLHDTPYVFFEFITSVVVTVGTHTWA